MKRDWWDKEFRALVTLGESNTAGGGASCRERCWASRLASLINEFQEVPVQLLNVGIGANVISTKSPVYEHSGKPAASERLEKHVISKDPDLLVIAYGMNDARGGTPIPLFTEELEMLIQRVREKVLPLIVLLGPYYMCDFTLGKPYYDKASLETFRRYNEAIKEVSEKCNCLFVDLLALYRDADWLIRSDGCHTNDLGHSLVANKIFEVLASNCSGLSLKVQSLNKRFRGWRDESTLKRECGY